MKRESDTLMKEVQSVPGTVIRTTKESDLWYSVAPFNDNGSYSAFGKRMLRMRRLFVPNL
ncbi:MAG: hypothetical protein R6X19_00620 [Kiritimatiellia bacterium]